MKTNKTFEIEISRSNVTPAQFLSYVRRSVDRKGGSYEEVINRVCHRIKYQRDTL